MAWTSGWVFVGVVKRFRVTPVGLMSFRGVGPRSAVAPEGLDCPTPYAARACWRKLASVVHGIGFFITFPMALEVDHSVECVTDPFEVDHVSEFLGDHSSVSHLTVAASHQSELRLASARFCSELTLTREEAGLGLPGGDRTAGNPPLVSAMASAHLS